MQPSDIADPLCPVCALLVIHLDSQDVHGPFGNHHQSIPELKRWAEPDRDRRSCPVCCVFWASILHYDSGDYYEGQILQQLYPKWTNDLRYPTSEDWITDPRLSGARLQLWLNLSPDCIANQTVHEHESLRMPTKGSAPSISIRVDRPDDGNVVGVGPEMRDGQSSTFIVPEMGQFRISKIVDRLGPEIGRVGLSAAFGELAE
jgi:hypothetical protein